MRQSVRRGHKRLPAARIAAVVSLLFTGLCLSCHRAKQPAVITSSDEDWRTYGGDWLIRHGSYENTSSARGVELVTRRVLSGDLSIDLDLRVQEPFAEAGVILRSSDEDIGVNAFNGYFAGVRAIDHAAEITRADYGETILAQAPLAKGASLDLPIHLHVVLAACTIVFTVTPASAPPTVLRTDLGNCVQAGHIGLRSSFDSATWTNLIVTSYVSPGDLNAVSDRTRIVETAFPDAPLLRDRSDYLSRLRHEATKHALPYADREIKSYVMKRGVYPDTTVAGMVISTPPFTVIDDGTAALILSDQEFGTRIRRGDEVEVKGTLVSEGFSATMRNAAVRVLWSDLPQPPFEVSALQLTSGQYRARSISIQGILMTRSRQKDACEMVLKDQNQLYRAIAVNALNTRACDIEVGSRVRLRGVATSASKYTKDIYPFGVIVSDVEILGPPPWWSANHILLVIAALFLLVILTQWLIYRLQQWHLRSVLAEREELAFDMHDTLAQSFTGIAYQLEAISMEANDVDTTRVHLSDTLLMVRRSHREASNTIAALRPQNRDASSILSTLRNSAERMSKTKGIRVSTEFHGTSTALPLPITDAFFRVGQEAITNALRHSQCRHILLSLRVGKRNVSLIVADDGAGMNSANVQRGMGLSAMRARASKVGATLTIDSAPGEGTRIEVWTPLPVAGGFFVKLLRVSRIAFLFMSHKVTGEPVYRNTGIKS